MRPGVVGAMRRAPALLAALSLALLCCSCAHVEDADPAGRAGGDGAVVADAGGGLSEEEYEDAMRIVNEQLEAQEGLDPDDIPQALADARAANPDVCAWLYVPGTNVTLPVCRSLRDNSYYLLHDSTGKPSPVGAAYIERENSPDFTDPVTVISGHTYGDIEQQIAFAQLHRLWAEDTFEETERFYVYTPGGRLSYEIASVVAFNDAPILESSGYFADPSVTQSYFDYVSVDSGQAGLFREGIALDAGSDRIVQLVTCELSADGTGRMVVTGVLVGEQEAAS